MANKVISIKMDEKDIAKLRKHFEFLEQTGFITKKSLSFNGFLKHLLVDYLREDFSTMYKKYQSMGLGFYYFDVVGMKLANQYELDEDEFFLYEKAVLEAITKRDDIQRKIAEEFLDFLDIDYGDNGFDGPATEIHPLLDSGHDSEEFWEEQASASFEGRGPIENEFAWDMKKIQDSELSDEEKERVITSMKKFIEKRKAERKLKQGY